jgi:putative flavoprotein involved in K+ transport
MTEMPASERVETIVVGGGQAGLVVGYHLARLGMPFVILDANERIGDSWRKRWDSLRLFSPRQFSGLAGLPFPGDPRTFPTKDEVADYLQEYATRFALPVRNGTTVDRLVRNGDGFTLTADGRRLEADNVVVAMATHQVPTVPAFATELDPAILQVHSAQYRNPSQLRNGNVLIVGAGNSGAEIAIDIATGDRGGHATLLAGDDNGHVPFRIETIAARFVFIPLMFRLVAHRVVTMSTPIGRRMRPKLLSRGAPLVRIKPKDIDTAGVQRLPTVTGVRDGLPLLADGNVVEAANVIWCTGFRPDFSWIDLPVVGDTEPKHHRGIVPDEPGLYFVGLFFLYAMSSGFLRGVSRDAEHVVEHIASRARQNACASRRLTNT